MRAVLFFLITLSMAGAFPQKASRAGMAQCIACPAGTYTSGGSATGCATCPANYYCPGASDKLACPAGATAAAGAANKNDCKALPIGTGLGGQYCAATNKNECTANAAWAGGSNVCYSNSSTYTAWDGSSVTYTSPYKARQNSYSIQASTWACTTSSSTAP
ncbi:MAG: hypothetical protein LBT92_04140, partial [Rickettsiales bacterium]|nr:hypothetical protein [Rickettsiales bacterium]